MLQPFKFEVLLGPAVAIFLATLAVTFRVTWSPAVSILAAFTKAGAFLVYMGVLFDGTHTFFDDWNYLKGGETLYFAGVTLMNLGEHWHLLLATARGNHFIYYLYNCYAFYFFGQGYFAPVAMNILTTILIAWLGSRLAEQEFGFAGKKKYGFSCFCCSTRTFSRGQTS